MQKFAMQSKPLSAVRQTNNSQQFCRFSQPIWFWKSPWISVWKIRASTNIKYSKNQAICSASDQGSTTLKLCWKKLNENYLASIQSRALSHAYWIISSIPCRKTWSKTCIQKLTIFLYCSESVSQPGNQKLVEKFYVSKILKTSPNK